MKVTAALIGRGRGQFVVVLVKPGTTLNRTRAAGLAAEFSRMFRDVPVVLAEQSGSQMRYLGAPTLVRELKKVSWNLLPWGEYALRRTA